MSHAASSVRWGSCSKQRYVVAIVLCIAATVVYRSLNYVFYNVVTESSSLKNVTEFVVNALSQKNVSLNATPNANTQLGTWKCCVDPFVANPIRTQLNLSTLKSIRYPCPSNPSNFSWFYSSSTKPQLERRSLAPMKWRNKTFLFVGGSTTRQMWEQLLWEMPMIGDATSFVFDQFLFKHFQHEAGPFSFNRSHGLDLRTLAPRLIDGLKTVDYVIFNVATWWPSLSIGYVIDENGAHWSVDGGRGEWHVLNETSSVSSRGGGHDSNTSSDISSPQPPTVSFAALMERAIRMMLAEKSSRTKIIWRSEGHTDCPPNTSFRRSILPILEKFDIPVLNISKAACSYMSQGLDDSFKMGPHLCFPSVALRYWLLSFQEQFLPLPFNNNDHQKVSFSA